MSTERITILKSIGQRLQRLREDRGMRAADVARRMGIAESTEFRREQGACSFPVEDLSLYASLFGVSPKEVLP